MKNYAPYKRKKRQVSVSLQNSSEVMLADVTCTYCPYFDSMSCYYYVPNRIGLLFPEEKRGANANKVN